MPPNSKHDAVLNPSRFVQHLVVEVGNLVWIYRSVYNFSFFFSITEIASWLRFLLRFPPFTLQLRHHTIGRPIWPKVQPRWNGSYNLRWWGTESLQLGKTKNKTDQRNALNKKGYFENRTNLTHQVDHSLCVFPPFALLLLL
jgi:hypothetical protein